MIAVLVKWPNKAVNYRIIIPLVLLPTTIQCQTIRQDTALVGLKQGCELDITVFTIWNHNSIGVTPNYYPVSDNQTRHRLG